MGIGRDLVESQVAREQQLRVLWGKPVSKDGRHTDPLLSHPLDIAGMAERVWGSCSGFIGSVDARPSGR